MMIGSATPTVDPLTGLKVGGTNGGWPGKGSRFWPAHVDAHAGAAAVRAPGTVAGPPATGTPPAGTAGAGGTSPGGGGTTGGWGTGSTGAGGAGSPGGGGAGASTPGAGGGGGSGSASATPLPRMSAAVSPTALHAAARGPLVHQIGRASCRERV